MKNIILLLLPLILCFMSGCSVQQQQKDIQDINIEKDVDSTYDEQAIEPQNLTVNTAEEGIDAEANDSVKIIESIDRPLVCLEAGHQKSGNSQLESIAPNSSEKKLKVAAGTTGVATKKPEYELTLEVALNLELALSEHFDVLMVRSTNEVDISNSERSQLCNEAKADVMLRIHADGSENKNTKGFSLLYPSEESKYTAGIAEVSKAIAEEIEGQMIVTMGDNSRGLIPRSDLTGFNWSEIPSVLVEMGFMTNKEEDILMSTQEYQDKIVAGIVQGLYYYYYELERTILLD